MPTTTSELAANFPDNGAPFGQARERRDFAGLARRTLNAAVASWFVIAVLGQLLFASYVAGFYGRAALRGEPQAWNKVLPHGYVAGDTFGNFVVGLHLAFAVVVILGGALQLIPAVRRRWPAIHRWNGRVYLVAVLLVSLAGLIMTATRGAVGAISQTIAISINAVLIIAFACMTYYHARARRIEAHRRWALRLFLAASGVWFFRIGLMFWIVVNRGPVGFDPKTFQGPFLTFLAFAQYVVPLLVLECYLRARDNGGARSRFAVAAMVSVLTLVTAGGIAAAAMIMWLPRL